MSQCLRQSNQETLFHAYVEEGTLGWPTYRVVASDPATQQAQEDIPKIRWVVIAKRSEF